MNEREYENAIKEECIGKDSLCSLIKDFLKGYTVPELLEVVKEAVEESERRKYE